MRKRERERESQTKYPITRNEEEKQLLGQFGQKILAVGGRITVKLVSSFTSVDSVKSNFV